MSSEHKPSPSGKETLDGPMASRVLFLLRFGQNIASSRLLRVSLVNEVAIPFTMIVRRCLICGYSFQESEMVSWESNTTDSKEVDCSGPRLLQTGRRLRRRVSRQLSLGQNTVDPSSVLSRLYTASRLSPRDRLSCRRDDEQSEFTVWLAGQPGSEECAGGSSNSRTKLRSASNDSAAAGSLASASAKFRRLR